jgi:uncharacterized protein DUF2809
LVVIVGFGVGSRHPKAPEVVQMYVGDVLWGALFLLMFACVWPRKSSFVLAAWAIATTELIELSQLYQADWILRVRATRLGGLVLGHTFLWSDVLAVFVGAVLAAFVDSVLRRAALSRRDRACRA